MKFNKSELVYYQANQHEFIKKFPEYSYHQQRMDQLQYHMITANQDYELEKANHQSIVQKLKL